MAGGLKALARLHDAQMARIDAEFMKARAAMWSTEYGEIHEAARQAEEEAKFLERLARESND